MFNDFSRPSLKPQDVGDRAGVRLNCDGVATLRLDTSDDVAGLARAAGVVDDDSAPYCANRSTIARPIPREEPVTIAAFR
jgi:hypothetical protein